MLVNCCIASNASDFFNIYQQFWYIFDEVKWSGIIVLFVVECRQREFEFHASGTGVFLASVIPSVLQSTLQVKV
jgi:hypothetical protein